MAYLTLPSLTRRLVNPLAMRLNARGVASLTLAGRRTGEARKRGPVISRYREVTGRAVDSYFTKLPDAPDHPAFQIGSGSPAR